MKVVLSSPSLSELCHSLPRVAISFFGAGVFSTYHGPVFLFFLVSSHPLTSHRQVSVTQPWLAFSIVCGINMQPPGSSEALFKGGGPSQWKRQTLI